MESQKESFEDTSIEHVEPSSEIIPVWGTILLWIAVPVSLAAVMFGIPWIVGYALRAMLGTFILPF